MDFLVKFIKSALETKVLIIGFPFGFVVKTFKLPEVNHKSLKAGILVVIVVAEFVIARYKIRN